MKKIIWIIVIVCAVFVMALVGGSFYMLDYSLAPDPNRMDTDSCYQQQFEAYPESKEWVDSLRVSATCVLLRIVAIPVCGMSLPDS